LSTGWTQEARVDGQWSSVRVPDDQSPFGCVGFLPLFFHVTPLYNRCTGGVFFGDFDPEKPDTVMAKVNKRAHNGVF
jgi:hypothetical protein